jgi:hypothetical protein
MVMCKMFTTSSRALGGQYWEPFCDAVKATPTSHFSMQKSRAPIDGYLSTQQPQHWIPCFTCTPLQSPTHLPQVHIQKPMKTGLG